MNTPHRCCGQRWPRCWRLQPSLTQGLATRFAAAGLFVPNAVAVLRHSALAGSALDFDYQWALMLFTVLAFGSGRLALDTLIARRCCR